MTVTPKKKFEILEARKCDFQYSGHQKACCFCSNLKVAVVIVVVELASF